MSRGTNKVENHWSKRTNEPLKLRFALVKENVPNIRQVTAEQRLYPQKRTQAQHWRHSSDQVR